MKFRDIVSHIDIQNKDLTGICKMCINRVSTNPCIIRFTNSKSSFLKCPEYKKDTLLRKILLKLRSLFK